MELKKYMRLLWRWWWVVVFGAALGGAGAYAVSKRTTPVYESSTTLLINQASSNKTNPSYNDVLAGEHLAKTYAELLRKQPVLERVIANLGLSISPATLAERVRVSVVRETLLVIVTVEDTNPAQAATIADEIAAVFWQQSRERQVSRYALLKQTLQNEVAKEQLVINTIQTDLASLTREVLRAELVQIQTTVNRAQGSLSLEDVPRQVLQLQLNQIQDQLEQVQTNRNTLDALGTNDQIARQSALNTQLEQHQSNYESLLRNLEEVRLAEAQTADYLSVAEGATVPTDTIRPRIMLNVLLAALLGALAILGLGFLVEYFDNSVRTREEIEQFVGIPTLAAIGRIRGLGLANKLVTTRASGSPIADAYRMLRTNIAFAQVDRPIRSIVISSSAPNEGKSTTAANLAVTMAQNGQRVALVDLDLREPTLHEFFKVNNQRGITTALLHPEENIGDYLLPTGVENLSLIPSGPLPSNPAELLGSQRMADLIEKLKDHADVILFDSSPMLVLADASLLARRCDATLLVARAGSTRIDSLRRVHEQLTQSGSRLLGVVLNRVPTSPVGGRYYQRRWWRNKLPLSFGLKWPFSRSR